MKNVKFWLEGARLTGVGMDEPMDWGDEILIRTALMRTALTEFADFFRRNGGEEMRLAFERAYSAQLIYERDNPINLDLGLDLGEDEDEGLTIGQFARREFGEIERIAEWMIAYFVSQRFPADSLGCLKRSMDEMGFKIAFGGGLQLGASDFENAELALGNETKKALEALANR